MTGSDSSRPLLLATVLVVEDNEVNLKLVRDVLEHHGYHVVAARDGAEGVALARERRPAMIFMDLQMPRMDGFAATREIRRDPLTRATPIVALTGFAMEEDRARAVEAGCDEVICKPFRIDEVVGAVQRFCSAPGA